MTDSNKDMIGRFLDKRRDLDPIEVMSTPGEVSERPIGPAAVPEGVIDGRNDICSTIFGWEAN